MGPVSGCRKRSGSANSYSAPTETGMCRLALSDEDREVRDWFCAELKTLGCQVKVDEMGNMFGIRPGRKEGKPTAMGSHLDTQPTGELKSFLKYAGTDDC